MRFIVLSVCLITILTGCGVDWFPSNVSSTSATSILIPAITLADAPTDLSYSQTLTATGGSGTYTWAVASGTLPDGLTLSAGGTISGTPTVVTTAAAGTDVYTFTVKVTDSATTTATTPATTPATATKSLSIFTPTTGRMNDSTGKVFAQGLTFNTTQGLALTVTNTDSVAHTIQVEVTDYETTGKEITHSAFNLSPVTVPGGASSPVTNPPSSLFTVNNWRIKSVSIQ